MYKYLLLVVVTTFSFNTSVAKEMTLEDASKITLEDLYGIWQVQHLQKGCDDCEGEKDIKIGSYDEKITIAKTYYIGRNKGNNAIKEEKPVYELATKLYSKEGYVFVLFRVLDDSGDALDYEFQVYSKTEITQKRIGNYFVTYKKISDLN